MWTPWGIGKMSCTARCPHFRGMFTLRKHIWDIETCSKYRGVLISGVSFHCITLLMLQTDVDGSNGPRPERIIQSDPVCRPTQLCKVLPA